MKNPWKNWSRISGISVKDIEEVAKESLPMAARHSVDIHRAYRSTRTDFIMFSPITNLAWLIGSNYDYRGGLISLSTSIQYGEGKANPPSRMHPKRFPVLDSAISATMYVMRHNALFPGIGAAEMVAPCSDGLPGSHPFHGGCLPYPVKAYFSFTWARPLFLPAGADDP